MADLNRLRHAADLIAGAVAKSTRPAPAPLWGEWATVDNAAQQTVVLDSDWEQLPRPVHANAYGPLTPDERVWIIHQGPLMTIVNAPHRHPRSYSAAVNLGLYSGSATAVVEAVAFPVGTFTAPPRVVASISHAAGESQPLIVRTGNVTAAGMDMTFFRTDGAALTGQYLTAHFIAHQN